MTYRSLECRGCVPRLRELTLRSLYPLIQGSLTVRVSSSPGLCLHLVSGCHTQDGQDVSCIQYYYYYLMYFSQYDISLYVCMDHCMYVWIT